MYRGAFIFVLCALLALVTGRASLLQDIEEQAVEESSTRPSNEIQNDLKTVRSKRRVTAPNREVVDPKIKNCANQHGVNYRVVVTTITKFGENEITDSSLKCALECVFKLGGLITEDGHLNATVAAENLPRDLADRDKIVEAFIECAQERAENSCELVYKSMMCLNNNRAFRTMHPKGTPYKGRQ